MKEVLVIKSEKITKIICQYHILPLFLQIYLYNRLYRHGKIGTSHANCTVVSSGDRDQRGRCICIILNLLKSITFLLIENLEMVGSAYFRLS